jgi:Asp-tRNA(Asn)/Glu-tRNA(Gln) amidotransferase A subunit family amidase
METTVSLTRLGAGELARSIAVGDVSSREAVDAHIDRIEEVDGQLNAVVFPRFEEARREADEADAVRRRGDRLEPLHGVPVTIKDQFDVAGLPNSFGVARLADRPVDRDGRMVAAWRKAGAIVLGKTNVPPALGAIETDNARFGRTNNPWDLARTPGGSSGGDAAIVAAGGAPLSLGADLGGSLRIPAAWCGVSSLVTTVPRLPIDRAPVRTGAGLVAAQAGPFARTTADVALALRVLVDAIVARPTGNNPPVPWREPPETGVAGLRVALLPEIDGFTPSPAIRRAIEEAAAALRSAGAIVEPWDSVPDVGEAISIALRSWTADGGGWLRQMLDGEKPHPLIKQDVQGTSLPNSAVRLLAATLNATGQQRAARYLRHVRKASARELSDLVGDHLAYVESFVAALDAGGYDLVLCPATPVPAVPHGLAKHLPDAHAPSVLFTALGLPAGVVPVTRVRPGEESDRPASKDKAVQAARTTEQGSAGLPVGVQVVARHWREDLVLAAMQSIETEVSPHPDHPGLPPL